jgi:hypothetical protein
MSGLLPYDRARGVVLFFYMYSNATTTVVNLVSVPGTEKSTFCTYLLFNKYFMVYIEILSYTLIFIGDFLVFTSISLQVLQFPPH